MSDVPTRIIHLNYNIFQSKGNNNSNHQSNFPNWINPLVLEFSVSPSELIPDTDLLVFTDSVFILIALNGTKKGIQNYTFCYDIRWLP